MLTFAPNPALFTSRSSLLNLFWNSAANLRTLYKQQHSVSSSLPYRHHYHNLTSMLLKSRAITTATGSILPDPTLALISSAATRPDFTDLQASTTVAPKSASCLATSKPMPRLAPVTTATSPASVAPLGGDLGPSQHNEGIYYDE